jgi:signal transduction histidine kinase
VAAVKAATVAAPHFNTGDDSASVIGTVRLVLAATTLITVLTDPQVLHKLPAIAWLIFSGFTIHNIVLYLLAHARNSAAESRLITWLDLLWYTALVFVTGSDTSLFFLLYFFTILVSAFRHGFDEGARVTLASAVLFSLTAHSTTGSAQLLQVLLRSAFLLALGYMIARWGESNLVQKRRLALLREVSRLSNPRFGVEHTINDVMHRVRLFFDACTCAVVNRRGNSPSWTLRMMNQGGARAAELPEHADGGMAQLLMSLPAGMPVLYTRPLFSWSGWGGAYCCYDAARDLWQHCPYQAGMQLAELLDARSFISVPLTIQNSEGRAFMAAARASYSRADVMFLCQIVGQVVPVLENIHVLDRLASEAALRERRKISHDLHDSTVQPYIGLSHTLTALQRKATPDNPLFADIDVLARMAAQVVTDLRHYVGGFAREDSISEPVFIGALRHHVRQVRLIYGVDIRLDLPANMALGDRLSAAAIHLVSEGISNIRKHTVVRQGAVRLRCEHEVLSIEIENACDGGGVPEFVPKSITERTESLGGSVTIAHRAPASTVVRITIPV